MDDHGAWLWVDLVVALAVGVLVGLLISALATRPPAPVPEVNGGD